MRVPYFIFRLRQILVDGFGKQIANLAIRRSK
jgi:hypothetical protein